MAGNPKTSKSIAPASGRSSASTKGVRVGVNAGKGIVSSTAPTSAFSKYKMGGKIGKK